MHTDLTFRGVKYRMFQNEWYDYILHYLINSSSYNNEIMWYF